MRTLCQWVISLSLVFSLFHSKPSHSVVGLATGSEIMAVIGGGAFVVSGFVFLDQMGRTRNCRHDFVSDCLDSFLFTVFGGVMLNSNLEDGVLDFVDNEKASIAGLSEHEKLAFNEERDEINSMILDIASEIQQKENITLTQAQKYAAYRWETQKHYFSQEAYNAFLKISQVIIQGV